MVHRIMFTLPAEVDADKLDRIVHALERKEFRVAEIEDLKKEG